MRRDWGWAGSPRPSDGELSQVCVQFVFTFYKSVGSTFETFLFVQVRAVSILRQAEVIVYDDLGAQVSRLPNYSKQRHISVAQASNFALLYPADVRMLATICRKL